MFRECSGVGRSPPFFTPCGARTKAAAPLQSATADFSPVRQRRVTATSPSLVSHRGRSPQPALARAAHQCMARPTAPSTLSSLSICALNRPPEGNASSTLTSCLHCVITAPPQPHDARPYDQPRHALQEQRHPPSVQVPRRRLHAAQRWRVIDSPALDGNELCAAPSYLRCALALPSMAGPVSPRTSPEEPHPQPSPLTLTVTAH